MSSSADLRFDELHRHSAFLRALAQGILRDEQLSEDVVQQVFLRALVEPPAEGGALRTWLARVAQRLALNTARERSRRELREQACARAEAVNEAAGLEIMVQRRILEAVDALGESYRATIHLRYYHGATPTQIARRLGLPLKTVEGRLTRAHRMLRDRLGRTLREDRGVTAALAVPAVMPRAAEAGILLGGLLLSKNALLVLLAAAALGGFWLARRGSSPTVPEREVSSGPMESEAAIATSDQTLDREDPGRSTSRTAVSTNPPDSLVSESIAPSEIVEETLARALASIESSFTGTLEPGAVLDCALLLAMHDFGPAIPEPNPAGLLIFPMLEAPDGVEAELQVGSNARSDTLMISLEMRFAAPRAPWLLEGRPHEEPKASVSVWTNDAGESVDFVVSTGAQPAEGFPFQNATEVPYGVLLHTDMRDPSAWRLSMSGLRPTTRDAADGERSWQSEDWELPRVLGGRWPRTAEMEDLARRLRQRYAEIRARGAR